MDKSIEGHKYQIGTLVTFKEDGKLYTVTHLLEENIIVSGLPIKLPYYTIEYENVKKEKVLERDLEIV